jgi:hypothetical protein
MTRTTRTGLLSLLVCLTVAAAGNYELNVRAERAAGPYSVYNDAELVDLIEAYQGDVEIWEDRYLAAGDGPDAESGSGIEARVRDFDRAQEHHQTKREVAGELGERGAVLRGLEDELEAREQRSSGIAVIRASPSSSTAWFGSSREAPGHVSAKRAQSENPNGVGWFRALPGSGPPG